MSEQFLENRMGPLDRLEEDGYYFDGVFSEGTFSPTLGINYILGEIGKESVYYTYKDTIIETETGSFFIKTTTFTSFENYDLNTEPFPNTFAYHNLDPEITAGDSANLVKTENLIVSFGEEHEEDLKNFMFAKYRMFLNPVLESKNDVFSILVPALSFLNTEIITEEVNNPDTFYTKSIPFKEDDRVIVEERPLWS